MNQQEKIQKEQELAEMLGTLLPSGALSLMKELFAQPSTASLDFSCNIVQIETNILTISEVKNANGAQFTSTKLSAGNFRLTSDLPIFANAKDYYRNASNYIMNFLYSEQLNGFAIWWYWLINDYTIGVATAEYVGILNVDGVLSEPQELVIKFK